CNDSASTGPGQSAPLIPANGTPVKLAVSNDACNPPKTHPAGQIIETVPASSPWAVAVRDDGLTYFSETSNNRIAITNTFTRVISGYIPTGSIPTGVAFSPDGPRPHSANHGDNTATALDVRSSRA